MNSDAKENKSVFENVKMCENQEEARTRGFFNFPSRMRPETLRERAELAP